MNNDEYLHTAFPYYVHDGTVHGITRRSSRCPILAIYYYMHEQRQRQRNKNAINTEEDRLDFEALGGPG